MSLNVGDETFSWESPALCLFHELSHSYEHLVLKSLLTNHKDTSVGEKWKNMAEKNAVIRTNAAAEQLGEPIRLNYVDGSLVERNFGTESYKLFSNNQKWRRK